MYADGGADMQLTDALAIARSGRALAFLGSGFSLGATSVAGETIPKTGELAQRLMLAAGETEEAEFDLAADLYVKANSSNPVALNTFLKAQFSVKEISAAQEAFCSFPWQRIYTTNYDDIVEIGSKRHGVERLSVSWQHPPSYYGRANSWIVHLHGFVGDIGKAGAAKTFLLGRQSYIDLELLKTQWPTQLQADLAKASAIFVMGFSFSDLHIARLFRQSSALKRKTFVIVRSSANQALRNYAAEFGTVVDTGIEGLLDDLGKAAPAEAPATIPLLSFVEHSLPEAPREPSPKDVFDLLVAGTFDPAVHLYSLIDGEKPYSFGRNYALREVANWDGSRARKFLISSRIGNGKSIFFRQLMVQLARDGFIVCEGRHAADTLADELDMLRARGQPLAFLYEGVRENEASIKAVSAVLEPRDILFVATRPTAFATNFDNLRNVLGEGFSRINLDTLQPADISDLDKVLDFYGLWAGVAGPSAASRAQFVRDECASEPRAVLLHLFRSSAVRDRINEPVRKLLSQGGEIPKVLSALLVIRLADCPIGFDDVCDLLDVLPKDVHDQFRAAGVHDLFPDTDHDFRARSPILSEYLLSELVPPAISHSAVRLLVERLVDFKEADWRFEESIGRILRFAIVTRIFRSPASRQFIISLYEAILNIGFLREDPQFWLQLAMARMDQRIWVPARKALDTSYEKAKSRPAYNTYMLDNQMTRFLFLNAVAGEPCDLDADAVRACELMRPRISGRGEHLDIYAFRLVEPLLQFTDAFRSRLGPGAKSSIAATISQAKDAIAAQRSRRTLDSEEERVWRQLRGR